MGVFDDVRCNNDLFGKHKSETHPTRSLDPVFPGSTYEITPSGRMELLVCTYDDRGELAWKSVLAAIALKLIGTQALSKVFAEYPKLVLR